MRKFWFIIIAGTLFAGLLAPAQAVAGEPRYWTGLDGRAMALRVINCKPAPGSVDILRVAKAAADRGLSRGMGANIVPAKVGTTRKCIDNTLYASLGDLQALQNQGWTHGTSGYNGVPLASLATQEEKRAEVCGGANWMRTYFPNGWSTFFAAKYPSVGTNVTDDDLAIIHECGFTPWIRDYGDHTWSLLRTRTDGTKVRTNVRTNLDPRGYYLVTSVNGGQPGVVGGYMSRESMIRDIRDAPPGSHTIFQTYAFVENNVAGDHNCADDGIPNWTSRIEDYCWEDYRAVLNAVAASNMVPASFETVARAWGLQ